MMIRMFVFGIVALNAWAGLRAGAATSDITAPVGAPMAGYFTNRASTGTHDPLLARALVLDNQGTRVAWVTCDLTNMERGIVQAARKLASDSTGIPPQNIMISASHTHTAPVVLSGWTRYVFEDEMLRLGQEYAADLPARIAQAVIQANSQLTDARLFVARGTQGTISFHRRYLMNDGSYGWNPGKLNPNVVKPAGPIDPAVTAVYLEDMARKPIATYVNFAIHLDTTGGALYSADIVYSLEGALRRARGESMVTLFSMGCAGNINHINTGIRRPQGGYAESARIGTHLAAAVLETLADPQEVLEPTLRSRSKMVSLTAVTPTPAELDEAHSAQPQSGKTLLLAKAARSLEIESRGGKPFEAEVQVIAVGKELAWVGLPGEIFVELGLDLKQRAKVPFVIPSTQTNGAIGYIPHREAYPQGNYEVVSTRVVAGSGEALIEAALEILNYLP